jgi:very-short-patch-repair endonuclease
VRNRQLGGLKFRRQAPLGPYFADFLCEEARLVVELDGMAHGAADDGRHDAARDAYLTKLGFETLRIPNTEFVKDPSSALEYVHRVARERIAALGSYAPVKVERAPR